MVSITKSYVAKKDRRKISKSKYCHGRVEQRPPRREIVGWWSWVHEKNWWAIRGKWNDLDII